MLRERPSSPPMRCAVTAGYGLDNRLPMVQIELGDVSVKVAPSDARAFALSIIAAAEAAMSDAFIVEFVGAYTECTPEQAQQALYAFRAFREQKSLAR